MGKKRRSANSQNYRALNAAHVKMMGYGEGLLQASVVHSDDHRGSSVCIQDLQDSFLF